MALYTIITDQNRKGEEKPLDPAREYSAPYIETSRMIYVDPNDQTSNVIGGEFIKTRILLEQAAKPIRFWHTKNHRQKQAAKITKNHLNIEKIMKAQEVMLQIHDQIIAAMREVYREDEDPDMQREQLRQRIIQLDIPGLLKANNLDISAAQGEIQFAFAGFQVGFRGEAVHNMQMVEDEKENFFLLNRNLIDMPENEAGTPPAETPTPGVS